MEVLGSQCGDADLSVDMTSVSEDEVWDVGHNPAVVDDLSILFSSPSSILGASHRGCCLFFSSSDIPLSDGFSGDNLVNLFSSFGSVVISQDEQNVGMGKAMFLELNDPEEGQVSTKDWPDRWNC